MHHTEITQNAVDEAADALLVSGDRPTPERVRAFIGTGAAGTIDGLLDTWWEGLGSRLLASISQPWLPPDDILQISAFIWTRARTRANEVTSEEHRAECEGLHAIIAELERKLSDLENRPEA